MVPLWGCGLEGEEINGVLVRARGDIRAADAAQLVLGGEEGRLADLPDGVAGITIEGRFGTQVEAVGRTARLNAEGDLPVYFSPPDLLCPVESDIVPREVGAVGLGPRGDVLVVGGQDRDGELLGEILHYRDVTGELVEVEAELHLPSTGMTVHPVGARRFLVVGGASTAASSLASAWSVSASDNPSRFSVSDPMPLEIGDTELHRAHHRGVEMDDGRILIVGGCTFVDRGQCLASVDSVQRTAFYIDPDSNPPKVSPAPPLMVPRFGHDLLRSRDGAVFAVGGRGVDGEGARTVEMLLPDFETWVAYGPALFEVLDGRDIVGATLLEGGLLIVALSDGAVLRVDENHLEALPRWCSGPEDACFPATVDTFPLAHRLLALPGERVLADSFVLAPGLLGLDGTAALDLTTASVGSAYDPPGPRGGSEQRLLDDGSVLVVGGRVPASGGAALPFVLRFRPALDGPDEDTPEVSALENGSFVVHDYTLEPQRISGSGGVLLLEPDPTRRDDVVATWAHVRGFRSRRFVFEATVEAQRGARPRFVFSRGAIARTVLAIEPGEVFISTREANADGLKIACASEGIDFSGVPKPVRVDVSPDAIEVRTGADVIARCPWTGDSPVTMGLGAVGDGSVRMSGLGLSRG